MEQYVALQDEIAALRGNKAREERIKVLEEEAAEVYAGIMAKQAKEQAKKKKELLADRNDYESRLASAIASTGPAVDALLAAWQEVQACREWFSETASALRNENLLEPGSKEAAFPYPDPPSTFAAFVAQVVRASYNQNGETLGSSDTYVQRLAGDKTEQRFEALAPFRKDA